VPSFYARLELFVTIINILEMRWQHVPDVYGAITMAQPLQKITRIYVEHNQVAVESQTKPT